MVDYSKWDNIELSDDSDVEVHQNVDKRSFIRWKQRDIHEKRMQRQQQIKGLQVQREMYAQLTKRAMWLLTEFAGDFSDDAARNAAVDAQFDPQEVCRLDENPDTPAYNEMLQDLFVQIRDDLKKDQQPATSENFKLRLKLHQEKIDKVTEEIGPKLEELEHQDEGKITSEDYREGFSSTFINKNSGKTDAASAASGSTAPTTQKIEVLNAPPMTPAPTAVTSVSSSENFLDEMTLAPTTAKFSELKSLEESKKFIIANPNFVTNQQQDALLMSCYDLVLAGDLKQAEEKIHQAIIIKWVAPMINGSVSNPEDKIFASMPLKSKLEYVSKFFVQLQNENSPLRQQFDADVEQIVQHIINRCEIIKAEQDAQDGEEGVEQIQLRSLDPNTELKVTIPEANTEEYQIFQTLPKDMQDAIKIGSLDAVNEVFAKMEISAAEDVLEKFNQSGVISVQALLENEDEFKQLQEELHEHEQEHEQEQPQVQEVYSSTADIVD